MAPTRGGAIRAATKSKTHGGGRKLRGLGARLNPRLLTLSVSMVATSSSALTKSPFFLFHCLRVPSEMDSAIWGTLTVSAAKEREAWKLRLKAGVAMGDADAARARTRDGAATGAFARSDEDEEEEVESARRAAGDDRSRVLRETALICGSMVRYKGGGWASGWSEGDWSGGGEKDSGGEGGAGGLVCRPSLFVRPEG